MLYAVKPGDSQARPAVPLRSPTDEGGHDADDMRTVLRQALRSFDAGRPTVTRLRTFADFLEIMAMAGPSRWFAQPSFLADAWREYFELADLVEGALASAGPDPEAEKARCVLVGAMTLLTSRVLAFSSQEARRDPRVVGAPLLATATRASERTRRWCSDAEPGKPQMLGVLSYAVVDVATQAVDRLTRDDSCTGEFVREATGALDEVLATLKQLAANHPADSAFDEGIGGHLAGHPSRSVRALQGLAWSHDVLGQAGVVPDAADLESALGLLESMWQSARGRRNESRGLMRTAAHLTSAWSCVLESGGTTSTVAASRALWLARQASADVGSDLPLAEALLELAQAAAAVAGISIQRGVGGGTSLAMRSSELVRDVVRRCGTSLPAHAVDGAIDNLSLVAAESSERGLPGSDRLAEQIRALVVARAGV